MKTTKKFEGTLPKPMTAASIKRGRGILKRTARGKSPMEERAKHKKQERALEERHAGVFDSSHG